MPKDFIPLPPRARDLTGQRFGRLLALGPVRPHPTSKLMWLCQCDCGNNKVVNGSHLLTGKTVSCNCFRIEQTIATSTRHGLYGTWLYFRWSHIVSRCHNPLNPRYQDYGGRGIHLFAAWRESVELFCSYVSELEHFGQDRTLDRINNDRGYEPGNVRWATTTEQNRNTRHNKLITFGSKTQCAAAWEEELGLRNGQIHDRMSRGWSAERALTTPRRAPRRR